MYSRDIQSENLHTGNTSETNPSRRSQDTSIELVAEVAALSLHNGISEHDLDLDWRLNQTLASSGMHSLQRLVARLLWFHCLNLTGIELDWASFLAISDTSAISRVVM